MSKQISTWLGGIIVALIVSACGAGEAPPPILTPPPTTTALPSTFTPTPVPPPTEIPVTSLPDTPAPLPTATPIPTATPLPQSSYPPQIGVSTWLKNPNQITYLTHAGDGSGRLFLVEKQGRVMIIAGDEILPEPFLDIRNLVDSGPSERGLLSIAFAPDYEESGVFYVYYSDRPGDGDSIIARYHTSSDPNRAESDSAEILLSIDEPAANHNGGQLQFGPDGYLYIGLGDGGSANDPWDNAENLSVLLGKMLRIAVDTDSGYLIPRDNPFVDQASARPEIWAYGLRNPWRFSFDRFSGDLYIADVGQNKWEEIDFQSAGSAGGQHYGWDTTEGNHCFEPAEGCDRSGITFPVAEYGHDQGCSVTGGYVYRGGLYPQLSGIYFFADFCTGEIWAMQQDSSGQWQYGPLIESGVNVASFGEDESGELYILGLNGEILKLTGS